MGEVEIAARGRAIAACFAITATVAGCGRLGFDPRAAPPADDASTGGGFRELIAYANQACAVFAEQLHCWGENTDGQLGDGTSTDANVPAVVPLPAGVIAGFSQGEGHACAIVDRVVHCWGRGFTGVQAVPLPNPATVVSCGRDFTCAIAEQVHCWGNNDVGQLADLTMIARSTPAVINSVVTTFTELRAGDDHACAREPSAKPECWGHNDDGALGTGSFSPANLLSPVQVTGDVATLPHIAGWHACALADGKISCWGRNEEGALGDGTQIPTATPQRVPDLPTVSAIATGGGPDNKDATCAILAGEVRCWGAGLHGRLGDGGTSNSLVPGPVVALPTAATDVAIGYDHACALLVTGDIYCWGRGDHGQLGDGNRASSLVPVRVTQPE